MTQWITTVHLRRARNKKLRVFLTLIMLLSAFLTLATHTYAEPFPVVAHAGGEVLGKTYTNSKEALDHNYSKGHRLFEVDMEWTSDRKLVLIHDWKQSYKKFFKKENHVPTIKEFKELTMTYGLTQLTLKELAQWLGEHPDAIIITDVKKDNIKALQVIKTRYPELTNKFIPQIYNFSEYQKVSKLGYKDIILTLYRMKATNDEILEFAKTNKLYAVTMPQTRALKELPSMLKSAGVYVYAHTINNHAMKEVFLEKGVNGIYTDKITPAAFANKTKVENSCVLYTQKTSLFLFNFDDSIKRIFKPTLRGRINIRGCGDLTGVKLSFRGYEGYRSDGKVLNIINKDFSLQKDPDGIYANYEIPIKKTTLRVLPTRAMLIVFHLKGKDGKSFKNTFSGDVKLANVKVVLSKYAFAVLKLRLLAKNTVILMPFIPALLLIIICIISYRKKDYIKNKLHYLIIASPIFFAISLEFHWGILVNHHPLNGVAISSLLIILVHLTLLKIIKITKLLLTISIFSIITFLFYYISFDIYRSFFTDYPSVAMLQHSGQMTSVLDSVIVLLNKNHLTSLALALIYILILLWNVKRQRKE